MSQTTPPTSSSASTTSPASSTVATGTATRPGVSGWWRAATITLLVLLSISVASAWSLYEQFKAQMQHMQTELTRVAHLKYLSVLQDERHQPAMLITFDAQETTIVLQRLNKVVEGPEDSMQLWSLNGKDRPRSLGVLDPKVPMQRLNATEQDLQGVQTLAISVENRGGVDPTRGPRLPYLFEGAVVQKAR